MNLRWRIAQFFEIKWWRRYLSDKEKTAYLNWKKTYWQRFLAQTGIELSSGEKVLDAGCGPAGIFIILDAQQIDALDPLLDLYRQKLPHFQPKDYPSSRFICQKIEAFHPDYQYDTIFCLNAVNHVADLQICLNRLAALTKPGGTLVLSVDAHNYPLLKHVFRLFPGDVLHPQQHVLSEYESMLLARGFRLEKKFLMKKEWIFGYWGMVLSRSL